MEVSTETIIQNQGGKGGRAYVLSNPLTLSDVTQEAIHQQLLHLNSHLFLKEKRKRKKEIIIRSTPPNLRKITAKLTCKVATWSISLTIVVHDSYNRLRDRGEKKKRKKSQRKS